MNKNNYEYKYNKYKHKYTQSKILNKYNFFIAHGTMNIDTLKNILNDGYIRFPKDSGISFFGHVKDDHIYANIYFKDLNNIGISPFPFYLILKPKIIFDFNIDVNKGWGSAKLLTIDKHDPDIESKMDKIYTYVKNPHINPNLDKLLEGSGFMQHELLFHKNISLQRYLYGIVISKNNTNDNIEKLIKKYEGTKIFYSFDSL